MNLSDLKSDLQKLGISTNTPGLFGDERYEELKFRFYQATGATSHDADDDNNGILNNNKERKGSSQLDELKSLSIGELRNRLTSLGVSTQTTGLTGEERWNALLQRLIETICGNTEMRDSIEDKEEIEIPVRPIEQQKGKNRLPPDIPPPGSQDTSIPVPMIIPTPAISSIEEQQSSEEKEKALADISYAKINELKKQLKSIGNKRSIWIASKFSVGEGQDTLLKRVSLQLSYIEQDISSCNGTLAKGETKIFIDSLKSISILNEILKTTPISNKDMMISIQK